MFEKRIPFISSVSRTFFRRFLGIGHLTVRFYTTHSCTKVWKILFFSTSAQLFPCRWNTKHFLALKFIEYKKWNGVLLKKEKYSSFLHIVSSLETWIYIQWTKKIHGFLSLLTSVMIDNLKATVSKSILVYRLHWGDLILFLYKTVYKRLMVYHVSKFLYVHNRNFVICWL